MVICHTQLTTTPDSLEKFHNDVAESLQRARLHSIMVISHTWLTTTQIAYKSSLMKVAESLACVKYIMNSIRAILALWVYNGFHPWPFCHYGWCIMNSIRGHFGIMGGGVLWIPSMGHFWALWVVYYGFSSICGHFGGSFSFLF